MKARSLSRIGNVLLLTLLAVVCASAAQARFAVTWEPVPLEQLLNNVGQYVRKHPADARGVYTLGRLHSLAFARQAENGRVMVVQKDWQTKKPLPLPDFPVFASVLVVPGKPTEVLTADEQRHLRESVRLYRRAVALDPRNPLYLLGLGWMLEKGATYAKTEPPPGDNSRPAAPGEAWRTQALAIYRRAYAVAIPKDLAREGRSLNGGDHAIGVEAGEGILRLLGESPRTAAERSEAARIEKDLATVNAKPGWVTPIVISLQPRAALADLLAPGRSVVFDLTGDGAPARWPWLRPDTGLLVWDPERTGKIVSGRQLFGSRTWQMFWRNGYEPLAALDNDRDGGLSGAELSGLAVWFDRNGNGVSDPGEVLPVRALGIVRIAVRPAGVLSGVPGHPGGVTLRDGTRLPTYDWTPRSIGPLRP